MNNFYDEGHMRTYNIESDCTRSTKKDKFDEMKGMMIMIYENKILPRLEVNKTSNMSEMLLKLSDLELISFCTYDVVDDTLRKESKKIVTHYIQSSDLLQFLSSAVYCNTSSLRYKLEPPLTTSKLDCEFILNCLAKIGYVHDFSYSSLTTSFWIELETCFSYSIKQIVNIGIAQLLDSKYDVRFDVDILTKTENFRADVFVGSDKRISVIHIELAAGLETDITSHVSQLNKLKAKIVKTKKRKIDYLYEYILISPTVFKQLPEVLQKSDCIITIDSIQEKLNSLDL